MKVSEKNSLAAAQYAEKKKELLARSNQIKREREAKSRLQTSDTALISGHQHVADSKIISREHNNVKDMSLLGLLNEPTPDIGSEIISAIRLTYPRGNHMFRAESNCYFVPPRDISGKQYDLSDRPLLCASAYKSEVVVGSADHALYSIDLSDMSKRHVSMHTKTAGHSDWITGVAHLSDGGVFSSSMDGKMCLWDSSRRRCTDIYGHTGSVTKVISDATSNIVMSLGYDGSVLAWNCRGNGRESTAPSSPTATFTGHGSPLIEAFFIGNHLVCGTKEGGVFMWDVETGSLLARYRGHQGSVTCVDALYGESGIFLTGGSDGFVKMWDHRHKKGAVQRIPTHSSKELQYSAAVTCLISSANENGQHVVRNNVDGYIVAGGMDNHVVVLDPRRIETIVEFQKWNHCRNGVYSLCMIGDRCIVAGDGKGMLLVYDILAGEVVEEAFSSSTYDSMDRVQPLKYGLGASSSGAVRCVVNVDNKIVACGEDGKVLVYEYNSGQFSQRR